MNKICHTEQYHYEQKVETVIVNNPTNINKMNNGLSLQIIKHKKDHDLAWDNKSTNINKTSNHLPPYLDEHKQTKRP